MADFKPDVVGIISSASSGLLPAGLRRSRRTTTPDAGGHGRRRVTIMTDDAIADPNVGFVVKGEGEVTFVNSCGNGGEQAGDIPDAIVQAVATQGGGSKVENIPASRSSAARIVHNRAGQVVHNAPARLVDDLDSLAPPTRVSLTSRTTCRRRSASCSRHAAATNSLHGTQNIWTTRCATSSAGLIDGSGRSRRNTAPTTSRFSTTSRPR